jgi:hypothetical protein
MNKAIIEKICLENHIDWQPIMYTKRPPVLSTIWDVISLQRRAYKLHSQKKFDLTHCRGYISSLIGLSLKRKKRVPFLFDMRGFWADEKKDAGAWPLSNPLYKLVYEFFKKKELDFFNESNFVVSLTQNGSNYIISNFLLNKNKIGVIPTCVDNNKFHIIDNEEIIMIKKQIGIQLNSKVFLYSGSLGTNSYDSNTVFFIYNIFKKKYPNGFLLILSKDSNMEYEKLKDDIIIINAPYNDVNKYLNIADIGFVFYNQGWSNIGRSPTKLGEYLYTGMKVISYGNMGDVSELAKSHPIFEIHNLDEKSIFFALDKLESCNFTKEFIFNNAFEYYSLNKGISFYNNIYVNI